MTIGYSEYHGHGHIKMSYGSKNEDSSFIFLPRVSIFGTVVAYVVKIKIGYSDNHYDIGVLGHGYKIKICQNCTTTRSANSIIFFITYEV